MKYSSFFFLAVFALLFVSCSDSNPGEQSDSPKLIFKFKFDAEQERLGNFGEPADLPEGNAGQSPDFHTMGVHYIELSEAGDIPLYNGTQIVKTPTTTKGGEEAIDFEKALYGGDGDVFFEIPLDEVDPGIYKFIRMSLSYQNYTIIAKWAGLDIESTIASFVGVNTYIESFVVKEQSVEVNGNRKQGYWAFEVNPDIPVTEGQAPAGSTTVPNPLADLSPIPPGSCLVTGDFQEPFVLTGDEIEDIVITCSISINKSFEWIDEDGNGTFDPLDGDAIVDMGTRGLKAIVD